MHSCKRCEKVKAIHLGKKSRICIDCNKSSNKSYTSAYDSDFIFNGLKNGTIERIHTVRENNRDSKDNPHLIRFGGKNSTSLVKKFNEFEGEWE